MVQLKKELPDLKASISSVFDDATSRSQGMLLAPQLQHLLRTLLPKVDDCDIKVMLNALGVSSEDGGMPYTDFIDFIFKEGLLSNEASAAEAKLEVDCIQDSILKSARGSKVNLEVAQAKLDIDGVRSPRSVSYAPLDIVQEKLEESTPKFGNVEWKETRSRTLPTPSNPEAEMRRWTLTPWGRQITPGTSVEPKLPALPRPEVDSPKSDNLAYKIAEAAREMLPKRVILIRHGESEGNVDSLVYRTKPDNAIELTDLGTKQAIEAGKRVKHLIGDDRVFLFASPFQRTLQTARNIALSLQDQIVQEEKDPRIREQEFGNLQREDFLKFRDEQTIVGRYFYRFPTGESGADVHARVKDWWNTSLLQLNLRPKHTHIDTVVVVTHGLTMRFILMQLFNWSPNTFQTVYNAGNCDMYVLTRDMSLPGHSPYLIDPLAGDMPRSTISLLVHFRDGRRQKFRLDDYLSVPMPRTQHSEVVIEMLHEQHNLVPEEIESVDFYNDRFSKYCFL